MTTSGDTQYDKIQQTHYDGCWADPKHHACAMREIERLRATIATWERACANYVKALEARNAEIKALRGAGLGDE